MARRKRKKKKLTPNQQAYKRQLNRIKRAYRELQNQGYRFEKPISEYIPQKKPERITQKAIKTLQSVTRSVLRQATQALDLSGHVVSGTEAFRQRRSEAARRAARTRKLNKYISTPEDMTYYSQYPDELEDLWEAERRKQDLIDMQIAQNISEGEIILSNVESLIERYSTAGATYLQKALNHEIRVYGRDNVAISMANSPTDFVEAAQNIIFYHENMDSGGASRAIKNFIDVIRATIPTADERRELGEITEQMDAYETPK